MNREGIRLFGPQQAMKYADELGKTFQLITDYPLSSPIRELMLRQVRMRPCGAHIILYEIVEDTVLVLRVRHGREDWLSDT